MQKYSLGSCLRALTARLDADVQALYDELETPLRPRFFPILTTLLEQRDATIGTLAQAAGVSQPAVTQTVAEMTRLGLVAAAPGQDGRERRISLSASGSSEVRKVRPLWDAVAAAAAELEQELSQPLVGVLCSALSALDRRSFRDRIKEQFSD